MGREIEIEPCARQKSVMGLLGFVQLGGTYSATEGELALWHGHGIKMVLEAKLEPEIKDVLEKSVALGIGKGKREAINGMRLALGSRTIPEPEAL